MSSAVNPPIQETDSIIRESVTGRKTVTFRAETLRDAALTTSSVVPRRSQPDTIIFRTERRSTIFSSAPGPKVTGRSMSEAKTRRFSQFETTKSGTTTKTSSSEDLAEQRDSQVNSSDRDRHRHSEFMDNFDFGGTVEEEDEEDDEAGYVAPQLVSRKYTMADSGVGDSRPDSPKKNLRNSTKRTSFNINGIVTRSEALNEDVNKFLDNLAAQSRALSNVNEIAYQNQAKQLAIANNKQTRYEKNLSILDQISQERAASAESVRPGSGGIRPDSPSKAKQGSSVGSPGKDGLDSRLQTAETSPETKPPTPQPPPRPKYRGNTISVAIPISFNLSRMLSTTLLNELQFARYEKHVNIKEKQHSKKPKKNETPDISLNDTNIPKLGNDLLSTATLLRESTISQRVSSGMKPERGGRKLSIIQQSSEAYIMKSLMKLHGSSTASLLNQGSIPTLLQQRESAVNLMWSGNPVKPMTPAPPMKAFVTTPPSSQKKKIKPKLFSVPPESKGIARDLYRQGDAVLGWKKVHKASWEQSQEWAEITVTMERKKAMLAEIVGGPRRISAVHSRKSSYAFSESGLPATDAVHIAAKSDNYLNELGMYNSLSKFVSKPQLGKNKKVGEDHLVVRAPPMAGGGGSNEKQYEFQDFVVIRKVSQTTCSTIRQVVLASIPAVRRRAYAMKTTMKPRLKTKFQIEAIRRERDIHSKLNHKFLVGMLASFQTPKRLYTIMEWCPTNLDTVMGFQRSIKEDACRGIIAELVLALEYLHSRNIIHRGIEPVNIQLDGFGHAKLSDFSTAITISDIDKTTIDTKCLRLTRYSAPELILGERHGRCVDWFSIGTLLYEMLTGNIPFGQGNVLDTLAAQYGGSTTRKRAAAPKTKAITNISSSRKSSISNLERQSTTSVSVPGRDSMTTPPSNRLSVDKQPQSIRPSVTGPISSRRFSTAARASVALARGSTTRKSVVNGTDPSLRRRSTKSELEHQQMVQTFTSKVKSLADEEKIHFVAGIASTGKNIVQLPYLYRTITEHYNVTRPSEDFVRRLMDPDHTHRLSSLRGTADVKGHPWFRPLGLTWKEIEEGKVKTFFAPGTEADDHVIAEFMKNLNAEKSLAAQAAEAVAAAANKSGGRGVANAVAGKGKGDDDDEDVVVEDGVKEEVDPNLSDTEITVLIHNTFMDW